MDTTLIVLGIILLVVGLIGDIVPGLPGVPFSYAALLLLHLTDQYQFSWGVLVLWAVITIVAQVLDYVVPAWGTKRFGGTKLGVWGSTIGLIVGLFTSFLGPWGVIIGPFLGAFIGEKMGDMPNDAALRAAFGSFLGILAGTLMKLICSLWMAWIFFAELF